MTPKKPSITDEIKTLARGEKVTPPKTEKMINGEKMNKPDTPGKNGGKRPGAGRPPGGIAMYRRAMKKYLADYFAEEQLVKVVDPKSGRPVTIKKPRAVIMLEVLYGVALQQLKGDSHSADLWLNRALGKAPQPLIGDEDEDPIQVNHDVMPILRKAYGVREE